MRRDAVRVLSGVCLMALAAFSAPTEGQSAPGATASLSAQAVPLGSIVELRVSVPIPPGRMIYFPDKLPTTPSIESHGAVRWTATPTPGGATLKLVYPLLALGVGQIEVPGLDVLAAPIGGRSGGGVLPGGSAVGAWAEAPAGTATVVARIPPHEVRSKSLFELEGVLGGVGPTPASDVVGANWGTASITLLLGSGAILAGLPVLALLHLRSRSRGRTGRMSPVDRKTGRRAALRELDALLELGLHRTGHAREFYSGTSQVARRYVECFDRSFGPSLTSTELMQRLATIEAVGTAESLRVEMAAAERVKFGPVGSDVDSAEAHWRMVRQWIEQHGKPEA